MGRAEFQLSNKQTYAFNSCMVHEDVTSTQTRHRVGVILLDTDMMYVLYWSQRAAPASNTK